MLKNKEISCVYGIKDQIRQLYVDKMSSKDFVEVNVVISMMILVNMGCVNPQRYVEKISFTFKKMNTSK